MKLENQEPLKRIGEAMDWADALSRPEPLSNERATAFLAWMRASPENVREYLALSAVNLAIRESDLMGETHGDAWVGGTPAQEERDHNPRRGYVPWGLAAGIAMLCLALGVAWVAWRARDWASYTTADNVAQNVMLDDGSVIDVFGDSSLKVRYSEALREVALSRGGGHITVRDEPVRPFIVRVGNGTIEAVHGVHAESRPPQSAYTQPARAFLIAVSEAAATVGAVSTAFNVLRKGEETGVFVSEGKVRVRGDAQEQTVLVTAGQSTDISADGHVQPVKHVEELMLRLESSTLAEMAEIFNRHNTVPQLDVRGGARDRKLGGRMRLDNTDELLAALVALGEFRIERRGNIVIIRLKYESAS